MPEPITPDGLRQLRILLDEGASGYSRHTVASLVAEIDRLQTALAESEKRGEAYFDGLEQVAARVSGVCNFDAGECAPPQHEGWAREMDDLNTFASETYQRLEAVYSASKAVTT